MTTTDSRRIGQFVFWLAVLVATTASLVWARGTIEQSHAVLLLLLVVLGGSAAGGRPLGFTLAVLGFVIIDYFFQPPYGLLTVEKPFDLVVLFAFLAAAFVATELLTRAHGEAELARRRTDEIASLSRLGSETLRYARPEDALDAITRLIQGTLGVTAASIVPWEPPSGILESAGRLGRPVEECLRLGAFVASQASSNADAAAFGFGGSITSAPFTDIAAGNDVVALSVPLMVEGQRVGILFLSNDGDPLWLDAGQLRFVMAISYYAALAAERVRLLAEAEHAIALRQENRAKDEILATVSHDLRTPLTTIKLLAQRAAARGDPSARTIEEQADRLARMVNNVLDLSRIRLGGITLEMELNTAEDLVGAAIAQSAGIASPCKIVPRIALDEPALAGRFDFVQSLRIVTNLLDNAVRHAASGGVVDIDAVRDGDSLAISVSDRGPGVDEEERDRIFEPFYRRRSEPVDGAGAGLGLSIARRLAEMQRGSVTYQPRGGGGSVFTLRLPATDLTDSTIGMTDGAELEPAWESTGEAHANPLRIR